MPLWRKMTEKVDFWVAVLASVMLMRLFHGGLPAMIGMISPGTEFIYNDRVFIFAPSGDRKREAFLPPVRE